MQTDKVTRFELIDDTGRILVMYNISIDLHLQDEGRTLKGFIKSREEGRIV